MPQHNAQPHKRPNVLCFESQVLVNVPSTRVQCENENRFMGHDASDFNRAFLQGKRLSFKSLAGENTRSVHVEATPQWE